MKLLFRCAMLMLPFGAIVPAVGAEELWLNEDDSH